MTGAGHDSQFWSPSCGPELVQRFYRDLDVGDTSCANEPALGTWVPGTFATSVGQAPAASQTGGPRANRSGRRLITATAWTVLDALRHNFLTAEHSVGLRSGALEYAYLDGVNTWTYDQVRFTRDVRVSGVVNDPTGTGHFVADLVAQRLGSTPVTVRMEGQLFTYREDATLTADFGRGRPPSSHPPREESDQEHQTKHPWLVHAGRHGTTRGWRRITNGGRVGVLDGGPGVVADRGDGRFDPCRGGR